MRFRNSLFSCVQYSLFCRMDNGMDNITMRTMVFGHCVLFRIILRIDNKVGSNYEHRSFTHPQLIRKMIIKSYSLYNNNFQSVQYKSTF